jgi:hypothetical protein
MGFLFGLCRPVNDCCVITGKCVPVGVLIQCKYKLWHLMILVLVS